MDDLEPGPPTEPGFGQGDGRVTRGDGCVRQGDGRRRGRFLGPRVGACPLVRSDRR